MRLLPSSNNVWKLYILVCNIMKSFLLHPNFSTRINFNYLNNLNDKACLQPVKYHVSCLSYWSFHFWKLIRDYLEYTYSMVLSYVPQVYHIINLSLLVWRWISRGLVCYCPPRFRCTTLIMSTLEVCFNMLVNYIIFLFLLYIK